MKLTVRSDYAARAVLGLARHFPGGEPQRAESLAAGQCLSANNLVHVLIELKSRHLVRSVRGKAGGYVLTRPPAEITLGDVLRCVYGEVLDTPALSDEDCAPELRRAWRKLQRNMETTADSINFQQLLDESAAKEKMYYI